MTVDSYLKSSLTLLKSNNVDTARLDTLVLMEHVLGINRAKLLVELDMEISPKHIKVLDQLVNKRAMHIPIAQLLNRAEFYGRLFQIDESVLVPRPESETIIDLLLELTKSDQYLSNKLISGPDLNRQKDGESSMRFSTRSLRIADVGTGSGALGITAKLELKNVEIDLIDIDDRALLIAKSNVVLHTISINTIIGDLLMNAPNEYDILLCNLPYIPDNFKINDAATYEPKIAIFGGKDGLDIYRKLFDQLLKIHHRPLYILTESFPESHNRLSIIAKKSGYTLFKNDDFVQIFIDQQKVY